MRGYYILEGKTPKPVDNVAEWAVWFESADRVVNKTQIGDTWVSTIFLGLDHSFGAGKPLLFETMIFEGERDGDQWRWHTWDEAENGHDKIVKELLD
jgi:hypothetical protein